MMPSVAYARMMNGGGMGEGITVGSGLEVAGTVVVGADEVEQDVNKVASKMRLRKRRCILSKGKVKTMSEHPHRFSQE